jgi:hypothetical protein
MLVAMTFGTIRAHPECSLHRHLIHNLRLVSRMFLLYPRTTPSYQMKPVPFPLTVEASHAASRTGDRPQIPPTQNLSPHYPPLYQRLARPKTFQCPREHLLKSPAAPRELLVSQIGPTAMEITLLTGKVEKIDPLVAGTA